MDIILPRDSEDAYGILHRFPKIPKKCDQKTVVKDSGPGHECKSAFDNNNDSYFCSDRTDPFPWITFEFPYHDIVITNYSLTYFNDYYSFRSYIIEGKHNDKWYLLDNVTDATLVVPAITSTRSVRYPGIYSVINITMTSPNSLNAQEFRIKEFDVFGSAHVKKRSCVYKFKSTRSIIDIRFVLFIIFS